MTSSYKALAKRLLSFAVVASMAGAMPFAALAYPTVSVTSASYKSVKITAQPQSFDGSSWQYQVCWSRVKNANGSLYVFPKSSSSASVASVPTAAQSDCTTFTAAPSTAYKVNFFSQPNKGGSLLVSRSFMSLSSSVAQGQYSNPAANNNFPSSASPSFLSSVNSNGNLPDSSSPALVATTGSTVYWPVTTLTKDPAPKSTSNPYCQDSTTGQSCYTPPADADPVNNYQLSLTHSSPESSSQWVAGFNYRSVSDGQCKHYDALGRRTVIQCYADHPLPTLSDSYVPGYDQSSFRYDLSNAWCVYTGAYSAMKDWGHSRTIYCTGYGGTAWPNSNNPATIIDQASAPSTQNPPVTGNPVVPVSNPPTTPVTPSPSASSTYITVGQMLQQRYGITWNIVNLPVDTQPYASNNYYSPYYTAPLPPVAVGLQYINSNGGKSVQMVNAMNYFNGSTCYHVDFSSGSKVEKPIQCYANHPLPNLTSGQVPTPTNENANFPWSLTNAQCIYIAGKDKSVPGSSHVVSCGGTDVANFPAQTTPIDVNEKIPATYNGLPMDNNPYDPNNPYSPQTDNNSVQVPTVPVSYGLRMVNANSGGSVQWVGKFLYTTGTMTASSGCYMADRTQGETPVITQIQCYANHPLPTWTSNSFPAFDNPTFDWVYSNAKCYYTAGLNKPEPGASHQISCGGQNTVIPPIAPVNPTILYPTSSDKAVVTAITYRMVAGVTSGAIICYKTTQVKGANSQYPDQYTMITNAVTCPDPLPPVLDAPGKVPSAHDTNFDFVTSKATCAKLDGSPFVCGTSLASTGTDGKCGSASGQVYSSLTSIATNLCSVGSVAGFSGSGPWNWQCTGSNGGLVATCNAYSSPSQQQAVNNNPTPVTSYKGQSANIKMPNTGTGAFLNLVSSNPSVVSVPSTVYVVAGDTTSYGTCLSSGTAIVTITGFGFPTITQSVTCN